MASWAGKVVELRAGTLRPCEPIPRYVGVPGMTAIAKRLASELVVKLDTRAVAARRTAANSWELTNEQRDPLGEFDIILAAIPPLQAAPLMTASTELTALIAAVTMQPCWAVMATFLAPLNTPFDGAFVNDAPLSWLARNSSKPGRPAVPETWVLHATGSSGATSISKNRPRILLINCWQSPGRFTLRSTGNRAPPAPIAGATRFPRQPLTKRSFYDCETSLGICGDWCGGPRVEAAFLSGVALAEQVLHSLA